MPRTSALPTLTHWPPLCLLAPHPPPMHLSTLPPHPLPPPLQLQQVQEGVLPPPPPTSSSSSSSSAPSLANAGIVRYADSAFTLALVPHSTPPHLLPSIYSLRYSLPPIKAAVALSLLLSADVPSGSTSVAAHRTDPGFNSFFSHYGKSTLEFLSQRARHPDFFVPPDAMLLQQSEVTVRMRAILVDWMWYVHIKYRLNSETMHLAASIVDRYLARAPVARSHLQLLGVTALLLASKHEECWCPDVDALVKIMDGAYSSRQVLAMEITVLRTLNFIISAPTPYHFLIHALRCLGTDERSYLGKCATALLDRSLQESDLWLGHSGADWEGSAYLQPPSDSSSSASASASCKGSGSGSGGSRGSYGGAQQQQQYQQRMGVTPQFIALSALSGALLALGGPREYEAGDRQVSSLVMGSVPISVSGGGGGRSYARIPWQVPRSVCRILGCGSKGEIVRAREVGYRMLGLFHKWDSLGYQEGAIAAFTVCSYPGNTSKSQITAVMKKYSHYRHGAVALLLSASYPLLKLTREHFEDVEGEVAV